MMGKEICRLGYKRHADLEASASAVFKRIILMISWGSQGTLRSLISVEGGSARPIGTDRIKVI